MRTILNLKVKNRIFLAPMEEVNDIAFRLLCKKAGAGLTYTGMIHPQTQQKIFLDDKPALQLFTTTTKGISEFMKKYDDKVALWDFNLGCPAKNARKKGFGSFLAKDLDSIEKILKEMREHTKKPLTIKIRKSENAFKILEIAEKYCDAICIHPRTQRQGYSGIPEEEFAIELRNKTKLPVIYSGNVTKQNAKQFLKKFDYVMLGREAIGRPNVFGGNEAKFADYLNLAEKYKLPFSQIKFQAMNFTKGKRNSTKLRKEIVGIKNEEELREFVRQK